MKRTSKQIALFAVVAMMVFASAPNSASAGPDPYIGEISYVAFNWAPAGWSQCDGQTLAINQYSALYAMLGTTFGGNGTTNFMLPDMRGRVPVHQGTGSGSNYVFGTKGGAENVALTAANLAAHNHTATSTLYSVDALATAVSPNGNSLAQTSTGGKTPAISGATYSATAPTVAMNAASVKTTTANFPTAAAQPFSIMQPYLTLNCIIATQGTFPTRP
jgi:microcystin-dependent protein